MIRLGSVEAERFRQELTTTFRALAEREEEQVVFSLVPSFGTGVEVHYNEQEHVLSYRFPSTDIEPHMSAIRGYADQTSAQLRYHDNVLHKGLTKHAYNAKQLAWYEALEEIRSMGCLAGRYPGAKVNLDQIIEQQLQEIYTREGEMPTQHIAALSLFFYGREAQIPASLQRYLPDMEMLWSMVKTVDKDTIWNAKYDQNRYGEYVTQLLEQWLEEPPEAKETQSDEGEDRSIENAGMDIEDEHMQVPSSFQEQGQEESADQQMSSQKIQSLMQDVVEEGDADSADGSDEQESYAVHQDEERERLSAQPTLLHYQAFTTAHDEIIRPLDIIDQEELLRYRTQLDKSLEELRDISQQLARKLQRLLSARQLRSWEFHQELGVLDAAKLPTLVADPSYAYPYKWEKHSEDRNTIISILLDNSGSMRGRPVTIAAMCADILIRSLERCGIKTELLGYTTAQWKGGQSKKDWLNAGAPPMPGRLNDLRHIIYKDAASSWRRTRANLGLMLKEGLLKENIDGEAILWAYDRLMSYNEDRRILMVISDGAPVDDSTLSANSGQFILDRHLKDVIHTIEQQGLVELMAIGIGHNVEGLYSKAITIHQVDELGDAMIKHLTMLFESSVNANVKR